MIAKLNENLFKDLGIWILTPSFLLFPIFFGFQTNTQGKYVESHYATIILAIIIFAVTMVYWYLSIDTVKRNKQKNIAIVKFNNFLDINGYKKLDNKTVKKDQQIYYYQYNEKRNEYDLTKVDIRL